MAFPINVQHTKMSNSVHLQKMSPVSSKFNRMQNKKLSCCCDSRSAKKTHYCVFLFLTLFIVIAASRPVNKNVKTGAVIYKQNVVQSRAFIGLNNWRTIKPLVQLLSLCTDPESHNAERYRQTDGQNT